MNVRRSPRVRMVQPGIGARLNRQEAIFTLLTGHAASGTDKIRVQRRIVLIHFMMVTAGCIRLPDLDQRVGYGSLVLVQHPPDDDKPLAHGFGARPGIAREITVSLLNRLMAEERTRDFGEHLP